MVWLPVRRAPRREDGTFKAIDNIGTGKLDKLREFKGLKCREDTHYTSTKGGIGCATRTFFDVSSPPVKLLGSMDGL
jgi:hypothetical protein